MRRCEAEVFTYSALRFVAPFSRLRPTKRLFVLLDWEPVGCELVVFDCSFFLGVHFVALTPIKLALKKCTNSPFVELLISVSGICLFA